jgi:hypothetical protein
VSGAPPRHPTVRVWSSVDCWSLVFLCHRTVRCHTGQSGAPLTSCFDTAWHCSCTIHFAESTVARWIVVVRWRTGQSGGTPDSLVNYSGARLRFPESGCLAPVRPWCTDTVRWHTRQSGAPDHNPLMSFLLLLNWVPNLNIYWFVLNLMHL